MANMNKHTQPVIDSFSDIKWQSNLTINNGKHEQAHSTSNQLHNQPVIVHKMIRLKREKKKHAVSKMVLLYILQQQCFSFDTTQ